jgi:hypothetical protein
MKKHFAAVVTLALISIPAHTQDPLPPDPPSPEGEHVALRDGSQCYYRNHFFDIDQQTTATVVLSSAGVFPAPRLVDRYGAHDQHASGPPGLYIFKADCGPTEGFGALDIPNLAGKTQAPIILDNNPPLLRSLVAEVDGSAVSGAPRNSVVTLSASASDPDGDQLTFTWGVNAGTIVSTSGATAQWRLPDSPGLAFAYVLVADGKGAFREGSTTVSTDSGIVAAVAAVAPPAAPSDKVNAPDHFLTFHSTKDLQLFPTRGADSRKGSCEYYAAIGAIEGCSAAGKMLGEQLTFAAWKAKWGFTSDSVGFRATYANIRDLDLERDMHGLTNEQGTAYYVCNYPHCARRTAGYRAAERAARREPGGLRRHGAFAD